MWDKECVKKLIQLYCTICQCNNKSARFTDSESGENRQKICNLTRNSTRNLWYHGVKLHVFALLRPGKLPIPCAVQVSKASYRAYIDADWKDTLKTQANIDLATPRKKKKCDTLRSEDATSTFISGLHQPIEIYFNWLNVRTAIQNASHVRSLTGLLFHIFASVAFAAYCQLFYY